MNNKSFSIKIQIFDNLHFTLFSLIKCKMCNHFVCKILTKRLIFLSCTLNKYINKIIIVIALFLVIPINESVDNIQKMCILTVEI